MFLLLAFGCILAFGCTLSFNRRCLQKFLHHLQSSFIIIFIHHHLLHSKTNTNTCVHTYFLKICYFRDVYWRFTKMYSPLSSCHRIIVMSSSSSSSSYSKTNTIFCVHTYSTICYFRSILQNYLSVTWIVF